jgi:TRAP-type C4-dicarboxylate transport system permease small subunit
MNLHDYGARTMVWVDMFLDRIARGMKLVAAVWLFALSIFILIEVVARGVLDIPIVGLKEVVANSIVIIAFLQLPYTVRIRAMLRADIIDGVVGERAAGYMQRVAFLLGAILFAAVAYAGWEPMLRAWATLEYEGEGGFRVPTYPVRTMIVIGGALGAVNFLLLAIRGVPDDAVPASSMH